MSANKCPHCSNGFFGDVEWHQIGTDKFHAWRISELNCPNCGRKIISLFSFTHNNNLVSSGYVYPKHILKQPIPPDVPSEFADDYLEACNVFADSSKASAALSRRCLQNIIREHFKIKKADLSK
jgi:hypothetical protein